MSKFIRLVLIYLVTLKTVKAVLIPDTINTDASVSLKKKEQEIFFKYYNGETLDQFVTVNIEDTMDFLESNTFNFNHSTVFYVHGHNEGPQVESVRTVIGQYLKYVPNNNVILVDWSSIASREYFTIAAPKTKEVAVRVAQELTKFIQNGLSYENIHLVGHSLGGQIVGFTGRQLYQKYNIKLKRVTALDPAMPMFYPGLILDHIRETDAELVDIIHTDAGRYGAPVRTGSVDFWPNPQALVQPGCKIITTDDLCSHWRSWRYWAESLEKPYNFPALYANNVLDYWKRIKNGDKEPMAYMGIATDAGVKGDFFLTTNSKSPFGTGKI